MIAHIFKGHGPQGRHDVDRRRRHRRAAGHQGRRLRPEVGPDGPAEPEGRLRRHEVARGGILREGLGYHRNDVAVVTNVAPDHLGLRGIDTLEQLANVKAVIVEAVPRDGFAVLNADDELVRQMRRRCSGEIVWFTLDHRQRQPRVRSSDHCRRGGRAVVLEQTELGDMIVIKHGRRRMQLAWTPPAAGDLRRRGQVQRANALAAAGAAFAAGAPLHDIRQGLRTFTTSYYLSPGRMNLIKVGNVEVFVDYCHNAAGMRASATSSRATPAQKQRPSGPRQVLADRHDRLGGRPPRRRHARARLRGAPTTSTSSSSARTSDSAVASAGETAEPHRRGRPDGDGRGRPLPAGRGRPGRDRRRHATSWPGPTRATSSSCASTSTPRSSPSWRTARTARRPVRTAASWRATPIWTRPPARDAEAQGQEAEVEALAADREAAEEAEEADRGRRDRTTRHEPATPPKPTLPSVGRERSYVDGRQPTAARARRTLTRGPRRPARNRRRRDSWPPPGPARRHRGMRVACAPARRPRRRRWA